jgi:plastocyanin
MRRRHGIAMVGIAVLVLASSAGAAETKLVGTVGPGFTIELRDAQAQPVKQLQPGPVEIEVSDRSEEHDFHLQGPGVDLTTGVDTTGDTTFAVTLGDGRYTFLCDAHPARMRGTFDVGTVAPPPTTQPKPTPGPTPSAKVGSRLILTVGPAATISLRTVGGRRVSLLRPGAYTVVARDRSAAHNARLRGAGAGRATGVGFVGTRTWRVGLRKGMLVVQCDEHPTSMRATVRVA